METNIRPIEFVVSSLEIVEEATLTDKQKLDYLLGTEIAGTKLLYHKGYYLRAINLKAFDIYDQFPTLLRHYLKLKSK